MAKVLPPKGATPRRLKRHREAASMVRKALKPKISAARAQDWISSVLNPIIDGVRREISLLGKPLRWLHETRSFEYLHSIAGYIADIYFDNFEDFLEKHPKLRLEFRRHDE